MANYAHPETLVSTDWAAQHASDPNVRVVEVDVDTKAYDEGHVPATRLCLRVVALGANRNNDQLRELVHEAVVALPLGRIGERRRQHEVQVAGGGVSGDGALRE